MAGYHTTTLLRQNQSDLLFHQIGASASVPVDIQDAQDDQPRITTPAYLLDENPVSWHLIIAPATGTGAPPDIRRGDQLIDPADTDYQTGNPAAYTVVSQRRWSWHLELGAFKPIKAPDMVAVNAQILAAYLQTAVLRQRVTDQTAGATPSASFEPYRQQVTSLNDGTHGVGWTAGGRTDGYLPPVTVTVGINDHHKIEQFDEQGRFIAETPAVYWQPPTVLEQDDVLVLSDGRRFRVGDDLLPIQVYGVPVLYMAQLTAPQRTDDVIFQLAQT